MGVEETDMIAKERYWNMHAALDAILIWINGEPHYRSAGGVPMGMPDGVRRAVKRALKDFPTKPGLEIRKR